MHAPFLKNMMGLKWIKIVLSIIFIFFLFYYTKNIDYYAVALIFKNVSYTLIILPALIVLLNLFLKGIRLKVLCNSNLSIARFYSIENISIFFASITPWRVGDFSKIYFLKGTGLSIDKSVICYSASRLIDITVIAFYAIIFYFLFFINSEFILFFALLAVLSILSALILKKIAIIKKLCTQVTKNINATQLIIAIVISLVIWALEGLFLFALIISLGLFIPVFASIGMLSLSTIAGLFTVLPLGIGPTDLTLKYLMGPYDISSEKVIVLLVLMRLVSVITLALSALAIGFKKVNKLTKGIK